MMRPHTPAGRANPTGRFLRLPNLAQTDPATRYHGEGRASFFQKGIDMLVLTRKRGQRLVISENVIVEVISILGDKVRLGIVADRSVTVHREEVALRIKRGEPHVSVDSDQV